MADEEYDELLSIGPVVRMEATWDEIRSWGIREAFVAGDHAALQQMLAGLPPVEWLTVRIDLPKDP